MHIRAVAFSMSHMCHSAYVFTVIALVAKRGLARGVRSHLIPQNYQRANKPPPPQLRSIDASMGLPSQLWYRLTSIVSLSEALGVAAITVSYIPPWASA